MYQPERLERWKMPRDYSGAEWPDYYSSGVGRSRDSDCLEESNFHSMLAALGGESDTVQVVRESHWAVGWVEWIAIHESDEAALRGPTGSRSGWRIIPCWMRTIIRSGSGRNASASGRTAIPTGSACAISAIIAALRASVSCVRRLRVIGRLRAGFCHARPT